MFGLDGELYIHTSFSSMTWAGRLYIRTPFIPRILHLSQRCHGCVARRFVGVGGDGFGGCYGVAQWFVGVGFSDLFF